MPGEVIIDFGCKMEKVAGAIGVDIDPATQADVIHDLNRFPYPFPGDHADKIYAKHIIEHLDHPREFIREVCRILKPGGTAFIETPHFSNYIAYAEPQHKLFFSYFMFRELTKGVSDKTHILRWKITFYKTFRFFGIQWLANRNPENYERFWTYLFPAENIIFEFSKLTSPQDLSDHTRK